jgi:hypothetical protein
VRGAHVREAYVRGAYVRVLVIVIVRAPVIVLGYGRGMRVFYAYVNQDS